MRYSHRNLEERLAATIFYLPDVIDHVPRHAPDGVAGVPSARRLASGGGAPCGRGLFPPRLLGAPLLFFLPAGSHPPPLRAPPPRLPGGGADLPSVAAPPPPPLLPVLPGG